MEVVRNRRVRAENSPDRMRTMSKNPMSRRVHVVYYLTRNGQLEHPHFMEVPVPANQPLRLRDVMDRLITLRGKGMPSLYSWSCKRCYRNGYVWNDLAENDVVCPSDGSEYVLKGSELVGGRNSEKFQEIQMSINRPPSAHTQEASNIHLLRSKPKPKARETRVETDRTASFGSPEVYSREVHKDDEQEEQEEEYEMDEEKTSYTSSTTPRSRCSRGVSTEELEFPVQEQWKVAINKSSGEPTRYVSAECTRFDSGVLGESSDCNALKRFEDGDPVVFRSGQAGRGSVQGQQKGANKSTGEPTRSESSELTRFDSEEVSEPMRFEDGDPGECGSVQPGRGSFLLQLIGCGNMAMVAKAKNAPPCQTVMQKEESLRKGVLCKNVVHNNKVVGEEDREMIRIMSENPMFGNSQAEEKEYFSGSIVEAMSQERVTTQPAIRRSNSFSEERNKDTKEMKEDDEKKEETAAKVKCIPRKKNALWSTLSSSKQNF